MEHLFSDSPAPGADSNEDSDQSEYSRAGSEAESWHDWLRLSFVALPATRCNLALAKWKTPAALLRAAQSNRDDELLTTPGITPTTVQRLRDAATMDVRAALDAMQKFDIRLLLQSDEEYPSSLRVIDDPPPYLFVRGRVLASDEVAVGIVGTRHTTEYGRSVAEKMSHDFARRGVTVVSGLARGVDTASHRGALEAGGRTFGVCGCGLDIAYPPENRALMDAMAENGGAVFSEFAPTVGPQAWHFPARNRIISGLSAGLVVVEAAERSGALITADFAMEQGREVFAVPGNIWKPQSRGCHMLIKQGATLVESADDVVAALNNRALPFERATRVLAQAQTDAAAPENAASTDAKTQTHASSQNAAPRVLAQPKTQRSSTKNVRASTRANENAALQSQDAAPTSFGSAPQIDKPQSVRAELSADENRVWLALDDEPRHLDAIAEKAVMTTQSVNACLVLMELKGLARRLPGNQFTRVL